MDPRSNRKRVGVIASQDFDFGYGRAISQANYLSPSKEQSSFNKKYILAFESESAAGSDLEMKTWFNAEAYHGIAAGVFYADQLVLKDVLGDDYSILTSNHPLPPNSTEAIQKNVNFFIQG